MTTHDGDDNETLIVTHETGHFKQASLQASSLQMQKVLELKELEK